MMKIKLRQVGNLPLSIFHFAISNSEQELKFYFREKSYKGCGFYFVTTIKKGQPGVWRGFLFEMFKVEKAQYWSITEIDLL